MTYADVAPSHVDWSVDQVEHVLSPELVRELERLLKTDEGGGRERVRDDRPDAHARGALAALSCGLLGNYLVLRRESLMGDAISHAVLPGLVVAFMISQSRSPLPMFLGATAAGCSRSFCRAR